MLWLQNLVLHCLVISVDQKLLPEIPNSGITHVVGEKQEQIFLAIIIDAASIFISTNSVYVLRMHTR